MTVICRMTGLTEIESTEDTSSGGQQILCLVQGVTTPPAALGNPGGSDRTSAILLGLQTGCFLPHSSAQVYMVFHIQVLIKAPGPFW